MRFRWSAKSWSETRELIRGDNGWKIQFSSLSLQAAFVSFFPCFSLIQCQRKFRHEKKIYEKMKAQRRKAKKYFNEALCVYLPQWCCTSGASGTTFATQRDSLLAFTWALENVTTGFTSAIDSCVHNVLVKEIMYVSKILLSSHIAMI